VSLDIDVLDAGVMPATGTPEPGGLSFDEVCALLRAVAEAGPIVGGDLVELAPISGFHAYDFTAAKLAYKLLAYAFSGKV
jgi:agmatinase